MLGVGLINEDGSPHATAADAIIEAALEDGMIGLSCGTYGNVMRLLPPLNLSDAELEEGAAILSRAFHQVLGRQPALVWTDGPSRAKSRPGRSGPTRPARGHRPGQVRSRS